MCRNRAFAGNDNIKYCGNCSANVFHRINVDPAVASGPLITTVNDLIGVVTYYGIAWLLLMKLLHLG